MQSAVQFITTNFTRLKLLKEGSGGSTEQVQGPNGDIYIRKIIPYTGLPYHALTELKDPALPVIFYAAEDDHQTYVLEEYIGGRNLQEIMEARGPLPESQVRGLALAACTALKVLHAHKILHRDIKPSNIILRPDGSIKLIDFGAARLTTNKDTGCDTRLLGTPGFAPPEQFGFAPTDVRSDLYALGMTLKTLLGPAYQGSLSEIIKRCTRFDPQQRINSAVELEYLLIQNGRLTWRRWQRIFIFLVLAVLASISFYAMQLPKESNTTVPATANRSLNVTNDKTLPAPGTVPGAKAKIPTETAPNTTAAAPQTENIPTPAPEAVPNAAQPEISSSNWNFTPAPGTKLDAAGPQKVVPLGTAPIIYVRNTGTMPLDNPQVDLYLYNFTIQGQDKEQILDQGVKRMVSIIFNGSSPTTHLTLSLKGSIAPDTYTYFSPAMVYPVYYRTGATPSVRLVVSAENVQSRESTYAIQVK